MSILDPTPPPAGWPGPIEFAMMPPGPTLTVVDVKAHPAGCVQLSISTPAGVCVAFVNNEAARKIAKDLTVAAAGIVLAGG